MEARLGKKPSAQRGRDRSESNNVPDGMTAPFERGEKQIRMPAKGSLAGVVESQSIHWPHRDEATRTAERRDNKKAGIELMRPWLH